MFLINQIANLYTPHLYDFCYVVIYQITSSIGGHATEDFALLLQIEILNKALRQLARFFSLIGNRWSVNNDRARVPSLFIVPLRITHPLSTHRIVISSSSAAVAPSITKYELYWLKYVSAIKFYCPMAHSFVTVLLLLRVVLNTISGSAAHWCGTTGALQRHCRQQLPIDTQHVRVTALSTSHGQNVYWSQQCTAMNFFITRSFCNT